MAPASALATPVSFDLFRLDGKVALVTGASRGLGAAMAVALAHAGADVVLHASGPVSATSDEIARTSARRAQLTKALANEWAPHGINVNAIAPGYMETDNTAALRADQIRTRQITERIPAGRWGTPQDLGGVAVFLASRASDYIHGHVLVVDGGWMGR